MAGWEAVTLTRARQVATLMGADEDALPPDDVDVEAGYREALGRSAVAAVGYLAHALPRREAIAWAADLLHAESLRRELPGRDRLALDHVLRWLGDPSEERRRATHRAGAAAGPRSAERYLAQAVFCSGGSIAGPDGPLILPPPEASGRWAAGAVKQAGFRTDAPDELFARALRLGEHVATRGMAGLSGAGLNR